jgi:hypothetical protein
MKEKSEINQSTQAILNEIKSLKRPNLEVQVDRPIRIAGKLRGNSFDNSITPAELRSFASKIAARGTYVKRVTIDHR